MVTLEQHLSAIANTTTAAFAPSAFGFALGVAVAITAALAFGLVASRSTAPGWRLRAASWLMVCGLTGAVERFCSDQPGGFRMLAICGVLLIAMKAVVSVEAIAAGQAPVAPLRWLAFAVLWPGMDVTRFGPCPPSTRPLPLMRMGLTRIAIGIALLGTARLAWVATQSRALATIPALIAISLMLHFGLFNVGAGVWRRLGVPCNQLFVAPLAAHSLGEFWGRRWNLAFTEMIQFAVYRPLSPRVGRTAAAIIGFGFSGVLHEMAISVPTKAGYGMPMAYFVLHGLLVSIERRWKKRGKPISARPVGRHLWTLVWLALPMPILFHPPFLQAVVWPLIGMPSP